MTRTSRAPFAQAAPGDVIYFKISGGSYFARAEVSRVCFEDQVGPDRLDQIYEQYNYAIAGDPDYWDLKKESARYVSLLWLRNVRACEKGPSYKYRHMCAWYVLPDSMDVVDASELSEVVTSKPCDIQHRTESSSLSGQAWIDLNISGGALRQGYLGLGTHVVWFDEKHYGGRNQSEMGQPFTVLLFLSRDLELGLYASIETDIVKAGNRFRSRRFKGYYQAINAQQGDGLRITRSCRDTYTVYPLAPCDGLKDG